jgi:F-type H+-transporting ATPase subunit gamma
MPSLKAIRSRISTVKNTQKITKAMKLVAAARLRRAQETIVAARPYARGLEQVIAEVAARAGAAHPLLEVRPMKRVEAIIVTSDRGLAGAFNSNINRQTERFVVEKKVEIEELGLAVVGRKGRDYLRRRKYNVVKDYVAPTSPTALERAREISVGVVERYLDKQLDGVFIIYNEFKSAVSQTVRIEQLLPVVPKKLAPHEGAGDFTYEPSRAAVLDAILPLYVEIELFRAMLESIASEMGARMSAMDNASKNASEMIARLTLSYNRARQAAITKELLEIIGGAEALKG